MSFEDRLEELEKKSSAIGIITKCRFAPSSFDLQKKFFLYPSPKKPWSSLSANIKSCKPRTVLTFLPQLLQMNSMVFWTLHEERLPEISMSQGNPGAGLEIVRSLKSEGIVTDSSGALSLESTARSDELSSVKFWHLVRPFHLPIPAFSPSYGIACHDLHLMPGVSIAYQCIHLGKSGRAVYHPSPDFSWDEKNGVLFLQSKDERPVPITRSPVGRGVMHKESCQCGADLLLEFYS